MGGNKCCVDGCDNHSGRDRTVTYHQFPSNVNIRQQWVAAVRAVNRPGWTLLKNTVLCSNHFSDACYECNIVARLSIGLSRKGCRLRPDAVPSFFPRRKRAVYEVSGSGTTAKQFRLEEEEGREPSASHQRYGVTVACQAVPDCSDKGSQASLCEIQNAKAICELRSVGCQVNIESGPHMKLAELGKTPEGLQSCAPSVDAGDKHVITELQVVRTSSLEMPPLLSYGAADAHMVRPPTPVPGSEAESIMSERYSAGAGDLNCCPSTTDKLEVSTEEMIPPVVGAVLAKEPMYMVSETQLIEALRHCRDCGTADCQVQLTTMGSLVCAVVTCKRSHVRTWKSQPFAHDKS